MIQAQLSNQILKVKTNKKHQGNKEANPSVSGGHFHLHLPLPSVALKLLPLWCQETALSNSPLSELQFSFLSLSFLSLFSPLSFLF